jgi:ribosome-associated toxin RatA of RatAB toxin-antitoxin module
MTTGREIRCFDYVNHPYARVRDVLTANALEVFRAATRAAASRAQSVASQLRVDIGGLEVRADIDISVREIEERSTSAPPAPRTCLEIEWKAASRPHLFPFMRAELAIYPLTSTETQLDFSGHYEPPLGLLGSAMDAIVGHRVAEVSVHRFVADVAAYLRTAIGPASAP